MKFSRYRSLLTGAGFTAVVALLFWMRSVETQLQREIDDLKNRRGDLARLGRDNKDLTAAISVLAASRSQPRRMAPSRRPMGPAYLPAGFVRRAAFRNAGTLTAEDAVQTFLWAIDRGEPALLAEALVFSDAARAEVAANFAKLPPAERGKYGSPEAMFALLYGYANGVSLVAMQIAGESAVNPDQVVLNTNWQFPAGQIREHSIPLYHTPTGWRVIVSDLKVDEILQKELGSAP